MHLFIREFILWQSFYFNNFYNEISSTLSEALKFIDNIVHSNDSAPITGVLQIEGDITSKEIALQIIYHFDSGKQI